MLFGGGTYGTLTFAQSPPRIVIAVGPVAQFPFIRNSEFMLGLMRVFLPPLDQVRAAAPSLQQVRTSAPLLDK